MNHAMMINIETLFWYTNWSDEAVLLKFKTWNWNVLTLLVDHISQIGQMRLSYDMSASFWGMTFVSSLWEKQREFVASRLVLSQDSSESLKRASSRRKPIMEKWLWYSVCWETWFYIVHTGLGGFEYKSTDRRAW